MDSFSFSVHIKSTLYMYLIWKGSLFVEMFQRNFIWKSILIFYWLSTYWYSSRDKIKSVSIRLNYYRKFVTHSSWACFLNIEQRWKRNYHLVTKVPSPYAYVKCINNNNNNKIHVESEDSFYLWCGVRTACLGGSARHLFSH